MERVERGSGQDILLELNDTVGNKSFVERVKSLMGALARGRKNIGVGESFQLREPAVPYGAHLGPEKCNLGLENTFFWDAILD
jgi:hypothetical protein